MTLFSYDDIITIKINIKNVKKSQELKQKTFYTKNIIVKRKK